MQFCLCDFVSWEYLKVTTLNVICGNVLGAAKGVSMAFYVRQAPKFAHQVFIDGWGAVNTKAKILAGFGIDGATGSPQARS